MTDLVNIKIDGASVAVPKGTLLIRAAEQVGVRIPRFCDHPLLKPSVPGGSSYARARRRRP